MNHLSLNTQAILLLAAPLQVGKNTSPAKVLTPGEYRKLARHLIQIERQPADFLAAGNEALLNDCAEIVEKDRLSALLDRGFLLSQALEYWSARAIWVISRADKEYPSIYKQRLGEYAPAVLYGCGDKSLMNTGGLAVVGSRHTTEELLEQTRQVGVLAARSGVTIVSGGAKGVDQASMDGALAAGGRVCGVLANNLEQAALSRDNLEWLRNKQLVLLSAHDPKARFTVWQAMERNKYIYALAQAALVMNSDKGKGGTWDGAKEQLEKHRFVPVYVRSTGERSEGLEAIQAMGAEPWPNPTNEQELKQALLATPTTTPTVAPPKKEEPPTNLSLFDTAELPFESGSKQQNVVMEEPVEQLKPASTAAHENSSPKEELFTAVTAAIKAVLIEPQNADDIAEALGTNKTQTNAWLKQLVDDNVVQKLTRPVRYKLIE